MDFILPPKRFHQKTLLARFRPHTGWLLICIFPGTSRFFANGNLQCETASPRAVLGDHSSGPTVSRAVLRPHKCCLSLGPALPVCHGHLGMVGDRRSALGGRDCVLATCSAGLCALGPACAGQWDGPHAPQGMPAPVPLVRRPGSQPRPLSRAHLRSSFRGSFLRGLRGLSRAWVRHAVVPLLPGQGARLESVVRLLSGGDSRQ